MRSILIAVMLVISLVAKVEAGDLSAAGAVSGFGQGLANSLSMIQAGMMQQALIEEQARLERDRIVQLQRYQLERDKLQYQREIERQQTQYKHTENKRVSEQPAQDQSREHDEAIRRLEKIHPDWRQVTAPGSPYRQWLAAQPASYQQLVNTTWDPQIVIISIDQFRLTQQDAYQVKVGQPYLAERDRAHFEELAKRVQRLRAQQEQAELGLNGH